MPFRARTLHEGDALKVRLCHYGPDDAMAMHAHDCHQLSWVLAGEFREITRSDEADVSGPSAALKPAGLDHADAYGPDGALIFSINIGEDRYRALAGDSAMMRPGWRPVSGASNAGEGLDRLSDLVSAGDTDTAEMAVADIVALASARPDATDSRRREVPRWLQDVRDRLRDTRGEADLQACAEDAGVHRVHLSRSFTRHFGMTPSLYRTRCRLAAALMRITHGLPLAEAAYEAGFADQSHFTRWARRETGLPPRRLQQLFAA